MSVRGDQHRLVVYSAKASVYHRCNQCISIKAIPKRNRKVVTEAEAIEVGLELCGTCATIANCEPIRAQRE